MARLRSDEVEDRLARRAGWSRDGDAIVRTHECGNFLGSLEFANRIAPVAEELNHHPDLAISWNKVTLRLVTHSEGGITENDFELAARIDPLV